MATETAYKYNSTCGMMFNGELVRISFDFYDNYVKATVISARNLSEIRKYGEVRLTHEQYEDLPSDVYDDMVFFNAATELFA